MNISNYTLSAVEAGMMMDPHFRPEKVKQVMAHRDMPWSTLQGWEAVGREIYYRLTSIDKRKFHIGWLWVLLWGLSVLSWTFALSGLTMQPQSGFKAGNTPGTELVGANKTSLNGRTGSDVVGRAWEQWGFALPPIIPLGAALYVTPHSDLVMNVTKPNSFPSNASSGIFLTPQAIIPVTGKMWGVILNYSCSGVNKLDEFTILNRRINSSNPAYIRPSEFNNDPRYDDTDVQYFYTLDDNSSISVLSELRTFPETNVFGFAEIGISTGFNTLLEDAGSWGYVPTYTFQNEDNLLPSYSGLEDEEVFEFALWQTYWNPADSSDHSWIHVENAIPELTNEYSQPQNPNGDPLYNGSMAAIGVRCTSSTVTGTATVNGLTGTFTDFARDDPLTAEDADGDDVTYAPAVPRFSLGPSFMFLQLNSSNDAMLWLDLGELTEKFPPFGNYSVNYTLVSTGMSWLEPLFTAANEPHLLSYTTQGVTEYTSLIQTPDLADALVAAYQQYAIQLMFLGESEPNGAWLNDQVTSAVPWTLLTAGGGVPPLFVVVTMLIWAVGCAGLSLMYGFRPRWSDSFDDYYLYRYCAELELDLLEIMKDPQ
jgi:hypothetical protein